MAAHRMLRCPLHLIQHLTRAMGLLAAPELLGAHQPHCYAHTPSSAQHCPIPGQLPPLTLRGHIILPTAP